MEIQLFVVMLSWFWTSGPYQFWNKLRLECPIVSPIFSIINSSTMKHSLVLRSMILIMIIHHSFPWSIRYHEDCNSRTGFEECWRHPPLPAAKVKGSAFTWGGFGGRWFRWFGCWGKGIPHAIGLVGTGGWLVVCRCRAHGGKVCTDSISLLRDTWRCNTDALWMLEVW